MNKFRPIQYLKKYTFLIIALFVFLTLGMYMVLRSLQTYTATTIIDYVYGDAENGLAPDGTELDTTGIYSSSVISQALDNLGLDQGKYPIDSIRAEIKVQQIADEAVDAVNEAKNKEGETSDLQSTKYAISYKADSSNGADMARAVLDEIMDGYFTQFSKQFINTSSVVNSTSSVNQGSYDYIEQIELIDAALKDTVNSLDSRAKASPLFYSSGTGYSFNELVNEFSILQNTEVSSLYSYILKHRVTKDTDALVGKYKERVQSNKLLQEQNQARVGEVEGILEAYVEKLRKSDNTAQSQVIGADGDTTKKNNVLGEVESPNYKNEDDEYVAYDQTTEYEQLLQNWIDISDVYNNSAIDEEYSQYVIDCFTGNTEAVIRYQTEIAQRIARPEKEGDDETDNASDSDMDITENAEVIDGDNAEKIYTEGTVPCSQQDIKYVEEKIKDIINRMNALYSVTNATDSEYNEYLGAEYIKVISSNHITEGINILLYTAIGAVLFLGLGCLGAIILGRVGDMIEYVAFTDHQFQISNRVACDRYINKYKEKILPANFSCLILQTLNQNDINHQLGRTGGDEILAYLSSCLRSLFQENVFLGYNGSGQFMIFVQNGNYEELKSLINNLHILLNENMKEKKIVFKYTVGFAVSSKEEIYQLRDLISSAMKQREGYEAGISD